ncbi:MAG: hypothetical protein PHT49_08140 [Desulfovibrionales bacterium]|nr:hypothetical protein [Desulfovibrionales bacterium]
MRHLIMINFLFVQMLVISLAFTPIDAQAQSKENKALQIKIQRIEDNVSEIRRDQLNYKIEKDLLKETFSSNYQTINIVLAIVLGIFSIIGFLGIRDIGALRKEFVSELERLNGLRKDFQIKATRIGEEQEKVKAEYIEIIKTNEEQNKRIKILELQEKISSLIKSNNYRRALEYSAVALDLSPDDPVLLEQKAICLWRTNDLAGAAAIYTKMFNIDPAETGNLTNLLEVLLISNRIAEYEPLVKKHAQQLEVRPDAAYLISYFEALKYYQLDELAKMKSAVKETLERCSPGTSKRLEWNFSDVNRYLANKPEDEKKALLLLLINVLQGKADRDDTLKKLSASH